MAGQDYICCFECGERLIYDGDFLIRNTWNPGNIYCEKCVDKLRKKVEKLTKLARNHGWRHN